MLSTSNAGYTAVWNALDYPACVFPVTRVDPILDAPKPPHAFIDDRDKANYEFCECLVTLLCPQPTDVLSSRQTRAL